MDVSFSLVLVLFLPTRKKKKGTQTEFIWIVWWTHRIFRLFCTIYFVNVFFKGNLLWHVKFLNYSDILSWAYHTTANILHTRKQQAIYSAQSMWKMLASTQLEGTWPYDNNYHFFPSTSVFLTIVDPKHTFSTFLRLLSGLVIAVLLKYNTMQIVSCSPNRF